MPDSTYDFEFVGAPDKLAVAISCQVLSGKIFHDYVHTIRKRNRITPPETLEELQANLHHYPPDQFEADAADFTFRTLVELIEEDCPGLTAAFAQHPAAAEPPPDDLSAKIAAAFEEALDPVNLCACVGKAVARHIVTGLLEIPPVIQFNQGAVVQTEILGEPVVVAVAGVGTNLKDLIARFEDTWDETFFPGHRKRGPDKIVATAWLHACERILRRADTPAAELDIRLAEIAFEIWPELRPPFDPLSDQYDDALFAAADRIRRNITNYRHWLNKVMPGLDDPDED